MTRLEALVAGQAARTPDAIAVVDEDRRVTYGELDLAANRTANALLAGGLRPDDRVCLLVPKSIEMLVYLLGVLKAGGVCVPLDTASPAARLGTIVTQVRPCVLISDGKRAELAAQLTDAVPAGTITRLLVPDDSGPAVPPKAEAGASGVAYLLFTSGSTGEPKGVQLTHEGIVHYVRWANGHFGITADERISCHLQMHFDGSLWDVYAALLSGAQLHLVPKSASLTPGLLVEFLKDARITQFLSVPSVLSAIARRDVLSEYELPDLRRVLWGGEVFPPEDVSYWLRKVPHAAFLGVYGTTETTIASTYHTVSKPPAEPLPVGVPIPGEWVSIVDEELRVLPAGEVGEVVIGGVGVTPGYWRSPERTARAFVELPPGSGQRAYRTGDLGRIGPDGVLRFQGRADRQVKISGYRVELDDLMAALHSVPEVAAGAVVTAPGRGGGPEICAAYTVTGGAQLTTAELRATLARRLPPYMVPTRWLVLDQLPVNSNGKTDLMAIRRQFAAEEG
ncbi:amino acid adenylation domain-containing protein [Streptomyces sp. LZ34]